MNKLDILDAQLKTDEQELDLDYDYGIYPNTERGRQAWQERLLMIMEKTNLWASELAKEQNK